MLEADGVLSGPILMNTNHMTSLHLRNAAMRDRCCCTGST